MQRDPMCVPEALIAIELAALKGGSFVRKSSDEFRMRMRESRKLIQKITAALLDKTCKVSRVICEIQERRGRAILLALKQHRRVRPEQHQSRDRLVAAWRTG